jgi:putative aldouronate transport system permease protein
MRAGGHTVAEMIDRGTRIAGIPDYAPPSRWSKLMKAIWRERLMYLLILPGFFYYILFNYLPLIGNVIAFQDWNPFLASKEGSFQGFFVGPWVGMQNFWDMFTDPDFKTALTNTIQIEILQLIFAFPAPLALALLLNSMVSDRLKRTMQTIVYLPHFLSWVIIISIWRQFFGGTGLVNEMLVTMGADPLNIMFNPDLFKPLVVLQGIWKEIGWGTIIFLAALTKIDVSLYEAAVMDGAGGWRRMRDVTMPGIRPVVVLLLILTIGNAFSVGFEQFFLQRNAVGADASEVLDTFSYFRGIQAGDYGFATAVGMVKSVVGLILIVGANWLARKTGDEGII